MNEERTVEPEDSSPAGRFGTALREGREKAGLGIGDVANALKVAERIVIALEAEQYEHLPARTYLRGYVQRYARLVGLDGVMLAASIGPVVEPEPAPPPIPSRTRLSSLVEFTWQRWGLLYGGIVFVFIAVIGSALWWAWSGENAKQAEPEIATTVADDDEPDTTPAMSLDEGGTSAGPPGASPASIPDPTIEAVTAEAPTPDASSSVAPEDEYERADTEAVAVTTSSPEQGEADTLTESDPILEPDSSSSRGADLLAFTFLDDCWIEVRDRHGELIHGDLGRGGDTVTLVGRAPFSLLVGYAQGVEIAFNGERVALEPGTRGEVTRLVVGH